MFVTEEKIGLLSKEKNIDILRVVFDPDYEGINLTNLAKKIGIAYKNLVPHIKKLEKEGFIKTERKRNRRGQEVIVEPAYGSGLVYDQAAIIKHNILNNKKTRRNTLEIIRRFNGKATPDAIWHLMKMPSRIAWSRIEGLFDRGLIQIRLELTKKGEEELKK